MGGPGHGPGGRHARAMGGKPKETKQTIKRLLGYLGKDKKHVIIALVCVVISSLSTLAGSYMLSPIINGITEHTIRHPKQPAMPVSLSMKD